MRCFGGLVSSRRYRVDQELEIYNFRVVPELQISKKHERLMKYMFSFAFVLFFYICLLVAFVLILFAFAFDRLLM